MHHKFLIIDNRILITGSFNWTRQAIVGNNENLIVTTHPKLLPAYLSEFERLWIMFDPKQRATLPTDCSTWFCIVVYIKVGSSITFIQKHIQFYLVSYLLYTEPLYVSSMHTSLSVIFYFALCTIWLQIFMSQSIDTAVSVCMHEHESAEFSL